MPLVDLCGKCLFTILNNSECSTWDMSQDLSNKKILITRLDSIGDVVLSTPILKPLKRRFPGATISYLVSSYAKDIIDENPYISEVIFIYKTSFGFYYF